MGIGGISVWQLLIVLLIVVLLFGTKKLKGMGSDLGGALKGFKSALNEEEEKENKESGDAETREENSPDEDATARREQDDGDAGTDRDKTS